MTFGELKKLDVPDETPLVVKNLDALEYQLVQQATIVVAVPGVTPLSPPVDYYDPIDSRADPKGIVIQVLLVQGF